MVRRPSGLDRPGRALKETGAVRSGDPAYLQFADLKLSGVVHGFFMRHGGVSVEPFNSLNVSFGVGDNQDSVRENRARLKRVLGLTNLISTGQIHGNKVLVLNKEPLSDFEITGYDAMVTDRPMGLMIQQADCQAIIFHDRIKRVIGAAHAGWRGSVADIIGETVKAMTENFSSTPADIKAFISPSLGPCCAEFVNYRQELPGWMHKFQVQPNHFDFWAISTRQLREAGLAAVNINTANICTKCSPDYYSYRRAGLTGRGATVIGLISP